ncbi:MAG TPA: hypothetical protein VLF61_02445 [Rhabdochlamydiaceae bacterium]|nr:hypothetical protein [Rhabdochlamydiaceae bacterium]
MTFDSAIFPEQNRLAKETRLTVMLKENGQSEKENIQMVLFEIGRHLKRSLRPDFVKTFLFKQAIPQFELGHRQKIDTLKKQLQERYLHCFLLGNYLSGASVNDCVRNSRELIDNLQQGLLSKP